MDITVYSTPDCVQCTATLKVLNAQGIAYRLVDLTKDDSARQTVQSMGYRQAPVVVTGKAHWSGFRPDMIARIPR